MHSPNLHSKFTVQCPAQFLSSRRNGVCYCSGTKLRDISRLCQDPLLVYIAIGTLVPWMLPKTLMYLSFSTRLLTTVYDQDRVVLGYAHMLYAAFCIVMYNLLCLHEIN